MSRAGCSTRPMPSTPAVRHGCWRVPDEVTSSVQPRRRVFVPMSLRARPIALLALFVGLLAVVAAGCGGDDNGGGNSAGGGNAGGKKYKIGVSNTLVGNGWREEMICAVKAQALASGQVSEVLVHNVNGDASAQIAGIRNLISSGANAIVINPADREALNPVIKEADARGIKVVAVDQAVTAPEAYVVTHDQVAYGRLGAQYL